MSYRYERLWAWWFALTVLLLVPGRAFASPQDLYGFGARSPGLAMTGASYAHDFEAIYQNPAGVATARRIGLVVGYQGAYPHLQINGTAINHIPGVADIPAVSGTPIGFVLPLPFGGPLRELFTIGAGFYTPTNTVMQTQALYYDSPQFPVVGRAQVVALQIGLGVDLQRWVPGLRVGFAISGSANTAGKLNVVLDAANQFLSQTETQLTTRFAPIVGVQYERGKLALGLVYRAKLESIIELNITINDLPVPLPVLTINALAQFDPHTLAAEASYQVTDRLRLIANLTYRHWSAYPGPTGPTSASSNHPPAPDFHDTVSPRVAGELTLPTPGPTVAVRFGYAFEPTPAKTARRAPLIGADGDPALDGNGQPLTGALLHFDANRHVLTAGFGVRQELSNHVLLRCDAYAGLQIMQKRTSTVEPPSGSASPAAVYETQGLIPGFGLTLGAEW